MKQINYDSNYIYCEPNLIELIGCAKNDIAKVLKLESQLSLEYFNKLSQAYALLDEVQEYLYEH